MTTTIDVDIDPDTPAAVADPRALEQVFYNLLDNAVKYCPGATVTVSARADTRSRAQESGAPTVEITVRDTGPGIEARHLDRIFERFYRVDAGRSRQLGGTGLGLSIVKHLVEAMHGAIEVSSVVGAGTKFTVELPRARLIDRPPTSSPAPSERISERPLA
ncbi:MAG: ATP-binding protein [Polyangiaceae bacterium]